LNHHLYAVIMAGGIGSRLWPRSRNAKPKQFLDLLGPRTMLQETVARIGPLVPLARVLVVVSEEHVPAVQDQIPGLPEENVLIEPGPRGTAPCIGLAAVAIQQRDPDATMAVCPADHLIRDEGTFRQTVVAAASLAQDGYLATLGIAPRHAHTGYGYIQRGASLGQPEGLPAFRVLRFTEKPDAPTAQQFVESGEYYWNGGIFVWQATTILDNMEKLLPELHTELQALSAAWGSPTFQDRLTSAWGRVPRITIDYGIMEKATRVAVLPVEMGWDDVGSWATLSDLVETDAQGNVIHGRGGHVLLDTTDTYIHTSQGRLVAAVGLEGFVVVDTPDALLVCPKDQAQAVRAVVDRLKAEGLQEYL
jgi:mannose-1-phosphate guanylyltransferase